MQKMFYSSLAHAIGAFVTGECEACQCEPGRIMLLDDDKKLARRKGFDFVKFEAHLSGLLSDLVDSANFDSKKYTGPVALTYATESELRVGQWQKCAQGYARIERDQPVGVEYTFFAADGTTIVVSENGTDAAMQEMQARDAPWYSVSVSAGDEKFEARVVQENGRWHAEHENHVIEDGSTIEEAFVDAIDLCDEYLDAHGVPMGAGTLGGLA